MAVVISKAGQRRRYPLPLIVYFVPDVEGSQECAVTELSRILAFPAYRFHFAKLFIISVPSEA